MTRNQVGAESGPATQKKKLSKSTEQHSPSRELVSEKAKHSLQVDSVDEVNHIVVPSGSHTMEPAENNGSGTHLELEVSSPPTAGGNDTTRAESPRFKQQPVPDIDRNKRTSTYTPQSLPKNAVSAHEHTPEEEEARVRRSGTRTLKLQSGSSPLEQSTQQRRPSSLKQSPDPFRSSYFERKKPSVDSWSQSERHAQPRETWRPKEGSSESQPVQERMPTHGKILVNQSPGLPWNQLVPRLDPDRKEVSTGHLEQASQEHDKVLSSGFRPPRNDRPWGNFSTRSQLPDAQGYPLQPAPRRPEISLSPDVSSNPSWSTKDVDRPDAEEKTSKTHQQNLSSNFKAHDHRTLPPQSKEYQQHDHAGTVNETSAPWPHLRRVGTAEPELPRTQPHGPFGQEHDLDTDWVNRRFEEHRQRRETQSQAPSPVTHNVDHSHYSPQISKQTVSAERVCGRCGEKGHLARQCGGATCYRCGEKGHISSDCPNPPNLFRRTDIVSHERTNRQSVSRDDTGDSRSRERPRSWGSPEHDQNRTWSDDRRVASRNPNSQDDMRVMMLDKQSVPVVDEIDQTELRRRERRANKWAEVEADNKSQPSKSARRGREEDDEDDEGGAARDEKNARKAVRKKDRERERQEAAQLALQQGPSVRLPQFVSVATLAQTLGVRYEHFVRRLERLGYDDIFPGMVLNSEVSGMIAMEYNVEPIFESVEDEAEERDLKALSLPESKDHLPARPPVVTIMGHVDHGKTTILDYLRKSSVAAGEAGGITQHIGAFSVPLSASGKAITFLDTPGHAAFLSMRQRGANVTDIVILVVAADDSVKPQTLEAIKHAKAAGVPIIVAINKVDKEEADIQRVKQDLARHDIDIEDYGGETQVVEVSGKTGKGMDSLEDAIISLSEILDHRAETQGTVEGWVLEATTKNSGRVATVLVRRGTLVPGTIIVAGKTWARVRTLKNEGGELVDEVGPGMPVEVDGWRDQPLAGDEVLQAPSEQKANEVVDYREEMMDREKTAQDTEAINQARRSEQQRKRAAALAAWSAEEPEEAESLADEDSTKASGQILVPFIIKADVSGSAEAVTDYIQSIASPLIAPQILLSEVGQVHESDIDRAAAAKGYIIAFNLHVDESTKGMAAYAGVEILENNIIYRVQEDVKALFEEKLPPIVSQKVIGEAEISASFDIGVGGRKTMKIAGCKIRNGTVNRGSRVRVLRRGDKIYDGVLASLKNVKKDVQEMRKGTECGMSFDDWAAFEVGDQIQTYTETSEKRKL